MLVTYKNNRVVPAGIIAICFISVIWLMRPVVESANTSVRKSSHVSITRIRPEANDAQPLKLEEDILLIMKTGGTTMWKRLLPHLTTSLGSERIASSNVVIYSDQDERVGPFTIIDCLVNMTDKVKESTEFDVYREQLEFSSNNRYVEAAGIDGDDSGPTGGWIIDKYKFLPLIDHAGRNWPQAKWYVYMEDDTYLFLPNLRQYLSKFNWRENHYLGSFAAKSDTVFAHGGSGFALSRGAWESSFGKNPHIVEDYYQYAKDHCCGDQVLAHALKTHGVKFGENGGDEKFTWGFNPLVHWSFPFSRYNWCSPLLSWHKAHGRDIARYYDLERIWDFTKPLLYRDFFLQMIAPHIQKKTEWWNNMASTYEISSSNKERPPAPEKASTYDLQLWKKAWESVESCEAACSGWTDCAMWMYVEDLCKMDDKVVMGQGYAPSMHQRKTSLKHTSGWLLERLENWRC